MKSLLACTLLSLLVSVAAAQRPFPPSVTQTERGADRIEGTVPPPAPPQRPRVDSKKLKEEADTLAQLAQTLPSDIDQTNHGVLPKDLPDTLKRIEKLAKHLRNELSQ